MKLIYNGKIAYLYLRKIRSISGIRRQFKRVFLANVAFCFILFYKLLEDLLEYQRNLIPPVWTSSYYWILYNFVMVNLGGIMYNTSKENKLIIYIYVIIPTSACPAICSSVIYHSRFFEKLMEVVWFTASADVYNEVLGVLPWIACAFAFYILQVLLYYYGTLLLHEVQCSVDEYQEFYRIGVIWDPDYYI